MKPEVCTMIRQGHMNLLLWTYYNEHIEWSTALNLLLIFFCNICVIFYLWGNFLKNFCLRRYKKAKENKVGGLWQCVCGGGGLEGTDSAPSIHPSICLSKCMGAAIFCFTWCVRDISLFSLWFEKSQWASCSARGFWLTREKSTSYKSSYLIPQTACVNCQNTSAC
jgi:hypothetical protein